LLNTSYSDMNGEGFLGLEVLDGNDYIVENKKDTGVSSIRCVRVQ